MFLPLIWLKMTEIAAMAKPEATAVANTERPLPDTAEAAAAPATTRLKKKVAKHSTATARHSSKLRASMDMGGFLSVTSALFSRRADSLDRMVTMCESTSRAKDSVVILGFVGCSITDRREKKRRDGVCSRSQNMFFQRCDSHVHFYVNVNRGKRDHTDRARFDTVLYDIVNFLVGNSKTDLFFLSRFQ